MKLMAHQNFFFQISRVSAHNEGAAPPVRTRTRACVHRHTYTGDTHTHSRTHVSWPSYLKACPPANMTWCVCVCWWVWGSVGGGRVWVVFARGKVGRCIRVWVHMYVCVCSLVHGTGRRLRNLLQNITLFHKKKTANKHKNENLARNAPQRSPD